MAGITTEMKVGIFVILGVLILIYMTATVGKWNVGRDKGYLVTARLDSAAGVLKDSPVKVLGINKGKIENLEIEKDKAKVYLRLPNELMLPEDSLVYVRSEGLLGDKYIEITPGSPHKPSIAPMGELLQGAPPADLDTLLFELSGVAREIKMLTQLAAQPAEPAEGMVERKTAIQSTLLNLEETSNSLKNLAKRLDSGEGTLGKILTDEAMYNELKKTLTEISTTIGKLNASQGTLGKLISDEEVYTNIKEITTRISSVIKKLERGDGVLGRFFASDALYGRQQEKQETMGTPAEEESEYVPFGALGSVLGEVTE